MHFAWRDADGEYDGEFTGNTNEYFNDASAILIAQSCGSFVPDCTWRGTHRPRLTQEACTVHRFNRGLIGVLEAVEALGQK